MENKKKPSATIFLCQSHCFIEGFPFREEMLDWKIVNSRGEIIEERLLSIYRNVLRALTQIHPFETLISLGVFEPDKQLFLTRRTHAEIFLNKDHVITLSHHSKTGKCFFSIAEWPELDDGNYQTEEEYATSLQANINILYNWSVDKWISFFLGKIKDEVVHLETKAIAKRKDATELDLRIASIQEGLGLL